MDHPPGILDLSLKINNNAYLMFIVWDHGTRIFRMNKEVHEAG